MEKEEIKLDEQSSIFLNDLRKLDKEELIDFIYGFWRSLKKDAENQINDKDNYMMEIFGRVKMTQVNRLKILARFKSVNK